MGGGRAPAAHRRPGAATNPAGTREEWGEEVEDRRPPTGLAAGPTGVEQPPPTEATEAEQIRCAGTGGHRPSRHREERAGSDRRTGSHRRDWRRDQSVWSNWRPPEHLEASRTGVQEPAATGATGAEQNRCGVGQNSDGRRPSPNKYKWPEASFRPSPRYRPPLRPLVWVKGRRSRSRSDASAASALEAHQRT